MVKILGLEILLLSCAHFTHGQLSRLPEPDSEEITNSTNSLPMEETDGHYMRMRQRSREYRLNMIRQHILDSLGWSEPPRITAETRKILSENPVIPLGREELNDYIREKQCFSSICELPEGVDYTLWTENTNDLRLYQELPEISSRKEIVSASLRLYIRYDAGAVHVGGSSRLLVSVYQFLRPLHYRRRGRLISRKRLIDAKMVNREGATWVILDVKDAVEDWVSGHRANYGLAIVVKDESENEINATTLFEPVDCMSPAYIGCREDEDMEQAGTIWTVGSYPYLQIETKERRRRRHARSVTTQFQITNTDEVKTDRTNTPTYTQLNYRTSPRNDLTGDKPELIQNTDQNSGCHGKLVIKHIRDARIISPKTYTTLDCSGTCTKGGNSCQPSRFEKLKGVILISNTKLSFEDTHIVRTTECSCV